jgi:hypothetical protein
MGVQQGLRPRLTAGLPFAPERWQIHHPALIGHPPDPLDPRNLSFIEQKPGL